MYSLITWMMYVLYMMYIVYIVYILCKFKNNLYFYSDFFDDPESFVGSSHNMLSLINI